MLTMYAVWGGGGGGGGGGLLGGGGGGGRRGEGVCGSQVGDRVRKRRL